ncbi:Hypothetical_protein [Hexamita inflata]|uniref:Hypothetical_protein n=1 Tax=Hexamita inflata TaxID=28002 RepID=A0ABP1H7Z1_9EUKA
MQTPGVIPQTLYLNLFSQIKNVGYKNKNINYQIKKPPSLNLKQLQLNHAQQSLNHKHLSLNPQTLNFEQRNLYPKKQKAKSGTKDTSGTQYLNTQPSINIYCKYESTVPTVLEPANS